MISFAHPWLLLLLLAVPGLVWWRHFRRSTTVRFSDVSGLDRMPPSWAVRAHRLLPVLHGLGVALVVVALARPRQGLEESKVSAEVVDIVLVVDVSPSMDALDLAPDRLQKRDLVTRLDAAKQVLKTFIEARTSDRMSIVAFSQMPYTICPLTLDHDFLLGQVERLETGMLGDGTAIGTAIASGTNRLRESKAKSRLMVLLTDGSNNAGNLTPLNAAQAAKALGFRIYTVGVGKEGQVYIKQRDRQGNARIGFMDSDIDEETLQAIARDTGGRFFRAQNLAELDAVYEEIDRMEKTEVKNEIFTRYNEQFEWFAGAGALVLALEALLSATRLGKVA